MICFQPFPVCDHYGFTDGKHQKRSPLADDDDESVKSKYRVGAYIVSERNDIRSGLKMQYGQLPQVN